jgi:hypothetical protein
MRAALSLAGFLAIPLAPIGAIGALAAIDMQQDHISYSTDSTFNGDRVVVEHHAGKLGFRHADKIAGYYLAGEPKVIGFGCVGAAEPMIAMGRQYLPRCERVAPIEESAK